MDPQIEFIDRTHHDDLHDLQSDPMRSWTYDGSLKHELYKNGQKNDKQLGMYSIVNRSMSLVKNHSYQIEAAYNRFKKEGHNLRGKEVSIILQDPITFLNPHWSIKKQLKNKIKWKTRKTMWIT